MHSVLPYAILHLSLSLITFARVRSALQPYSSNQCNTARLESKLTRQFKTCSSHHMRLTPVFKQGSMPRIPTTTLSYETTTPPRYEECSRFFSGTLLYSHSSSFL
jgi:hypothetical protein